METYGCGIAYGWMYDGCGLIRGSFCFSNKGVGSSWVSLILVKAKGGKETTEVVYKLLFALKNHLQTASVMVLQDISKKMGLGSPTVSLSLCVSVCECVSVSVSLSLSLSL